MDKCYQLIDQFPLPVNSNDFYVISASLSHIQNFIYDTPSNGALKSLRGKSFYLTLLSHAICDTILNRLDLQRDTVLYNSSGACCIVAPYSPTIENNTAECAKHIKNAISRDLGYDGAEICGVKASHEELENNCADIFAKLFAQKHRTKFSPYQGEENYDYLFNPQPPKQYKSFEQIGAKLCDTTAILVSREELQFADSLHIDMSSLGVHFYMGNATELATIKSEGAYLLLVNNTPVPDGCVVPTYREYIAGNGTRANSFSDLFSDNDSSHQRLAVLRMDVDNLGLLLQSIMRKKNALSEYASMSHKLDAFFNGQINQIWTSNYSETTVIIYAGGDDLFIVGEWEKTLNFMREIYTQFKVAFADDKMGISGGISLISPKYPIIRAAELSAIEEQSAKNFDYAGQQKNCISIFGIPLRWECELDMVMRYKTRLFELIQKGEIGKSFVQHILRINENVRFESGKIVPIRYIWIAAYDLSRLMKRNNTNTEGNRFIKQCVQDIMSGRTLAGEPIHSPYHSLQLIVIAARFVQMLLWKTNK